MEKGCAHPDPVEHAKGARQHFVTGLRGVTGNISGIPREMAAVRFATFLGIPPRASKPARDEHGLAILSSDDFQPIQERLLDAGEGITLGPATATPKLLGAEMDHSSSTPGLRMPR